MRSQAEDDADANDRESEVRPRSAFTDYTEEVAASASSAREEAQEPEAQEPEAPGLRLVPPPEPSSEPPEPPASVPPPDSVPPPASVPPAAIVAVPETKSEIGIVPETPRAVVLPPWAGVETVMETSRETVMEKTSVPPTPAPAALGAPRFLTRRAGIVFAGALLCVNAAIGAGVLHVRSEARHAVAPIATIAAEVKEQSASVSQARAQLTEVRAKLEETHEEVAKDHEALTRTVVKVEESAAKQESIEHALKQLETREKSDFATLANRLRIAEKRTPDGAFAVSLGEATQLIDAAGGKPKEPAHAKADAEHGKPEHGKPEHGRAEAEHARPEPHVDW